jgi:hypothetical protein
MKQIERQNNKRQRVCLAILYCILGIVLCPSCSRDFQEVVEEEKESVQGWMSIRLSDPDEGVTYATVVDNEAEYNLQNLAVYMFEGTGDNYVLGKIFSDGNSNIEYLTGHYKAQYIRLNVTGCIDGNKRFVIIANVNGTGQMQCSDLKSVQTGTTLAAFLNLAYDVPADNSAAFLSSIVRSDWGFPMTASQVGSPEKLYVEASLNVSAGTNVSGVSLKRRVARIDIINADNTNFTLEKILLRGVPEAAYLCNVENTAVANADYEEELSLSQLVKKGGKYSFYVFPGTMISRQDPSEALEPTIVLQGKRLEYYPLENEWGEKNGVRFSPARPEESDLAAKANGKYNLNMPAYEGGLDIYLCIGQSNMAGYADKNAGYPYPSDIIPGAYLFKNKDEQVWEKAANPLNKYSTTNSGGYLSLAYNFAKEMRSYYPNYAVGLVHNADGGTNLHTQWKAWTGNLFAITQTRMAEVKATRAGVVRGILWHQGESDSAEPYRSAYMNNFTDFVNAWRTILDNPDLSIVAGEILSAYSDNQRLWNEMFQAAPTQIPYMSLVSHDGTSGSTGDMIHFNSVSLNLLGERYAAAMKELREKQKTEKSIKSSVQESNPGIISLSVVEYEN